MSTTFHLWSLGDKTALLMSETALRLARCRYVFLSIRQAVVVTIAKTRYSVTARDELVTSVLLHYVVFSSALLVCKHVLTFKCLGNISPTRVDLTNIRHFQNDKTMM